MREQMVQQERKEALQKQQQIQKLQTNSRLTSHHLDIGSTVINNNSNVGSGNINNNNSANSSSVITIAGGNGEHRGVRSIPHSTSTKLSEAASCPNFFTDGFNNSDNGLPISNLPIGSTSSSSSALITNSSTTTTSSTTIIPSKSVASHHHHPSLINNANGSGPQSPFPLSPDSPLSGPRSSASEIDGDYWEDVQRTFGLEMSDLMDHNSGNNGNGDNGGSAHNNGEGGSGPMGPSSSINVIHHHSHHHQSHHSPMDPIPATLPADISYIFNPHQLYGGEDSQQSTSRLSDATKMSSSCPPLSTSCPPLSSDPEYSAWERERKKKDAHNKIERRRRYNINDRIKELSTLLPTQDEIHYELVKDMKQNKGTILKASVDFLRSLKRDVTRIPELERQKRELEIENRKMSARIQQLEQDLRRQALISDEQQQHGLYKPDPSAPKSIQFGQNQHHHHHGHHVHSTHHETPTPPPQPQSLPHHLTHSFHHPETDYWINESITIDDNANTGHNNLQSHPQHITSGHHTNPDNDLVETLYGPALRISAHHPIIKQEYNVSPSQSSSGLGSLSSPTSLSSSFLPLSQMLINDASKDSLGITNQHVKGELPSPQVMDVCD